MGTGRPHAIGSKICSRSPRHLRNRRRSIRRRTLGLLERGLLLPGRQAWLLGPGGRRCLCLSSGSYGSHSVVKMELKHLRQGRNTEVSQHHLRLIASVSQCLFFSLLSYH